MPKFRVRIDNQPHRPPLHRRARDSEIAPSAKHLTKFSGFGFEDTPRASPTAILTIRTGLKNPGVVSRWYGGCLQRHFRIGGIKFRRLIDGRSAQQAADRLSGGISIEIADTTSPVLLLEILFS